MMPITLMSLLLLLFGEVTPRPINSVFRSERMHDSFYYQTLHINCTKRGLAMHQQGFHSRRFHSPPSNLPMPLAGSVPI